MLNSSVINSSLVETRQAKAFQIHMSRRGRLCLLLIAFVTLLGLVAVRPVPALADSPPFSLDTAASANLPGVGNSSVTWGDYDNDGRLDILLIGWVGTQNVSGVYRNSGSGFTDINAGLPAVSTGSTAWGDYDNDGDLDILLAGYQHASGTSITRIYRNTGTGFVDIEAGLPALQRNSAVWGDYDNDGDLDILLSGGPGYGGMARVYQNTGDSFVDINAGLPDVAYSSAAWGDYDNDGRLDILLTGWAAPNYMTRVYRNTPSGFVDINAGLPGVESGSVTWGDYNNDGRLDILLVGSTSFGSDALARVYRNTGTAFVDAGANLPGVDNAAAAWGDYDNDGKLDILLSGNTGSEYITRVYRNTGSDFMSIDAGLPGVYYGSVVWGDYDNDGDLDILLTGYNSTTGRISRIYRNDTLSANTPPAAPTSLSSMVNGNQVTLAWEAPADDWTPIAGLSYNLRVGSVPGQANIVSPMACEIGCGVGPAGYRQVVALGNANQGISATLILPPGAYTWSVQAVDSAFAGSPFSAEGSFKIVGPPPPGVEYGSLAWGDYDNDGDLDLLMTGRLDHQDPMMPTLPVMATKIYRNDRGSFTNSYAGLPDVGYSSAAWGDYDNDGDLDILLSGRTNLDDPLTEIYRNDGGSFTDINAGLNEVGYSAVAWGDYDNDGDLDILLTGADDSGPVTQIYQNNAGVFANINAGLIGVGFGSAAWGDYDNDGDLDILLTGSGYNNPVTRIYRNDGGSFIPVNAGLVNVANSSAAWGDYDNDGDLDILLSGWVDFNTPTLTTKIYRNDGGSFTDMNAGLPGLGYSAAAWGDYDNDGDLDILLAGKTNADFYNHVMATKIYRNDGGSFSDTNAGLAGVGMGAVAWADYDNDGDLDTLLTGYTGSAIVTEMYLNDAPTPNVRPAAPAGLVASTSGTTATLSWNAAADSQTSSPGLTYNLRVGRSPGGEDALGPMADGATGYRRIPQWGNAQHGLTARLTLPPGTYYWSVQAIDSAGAGSDFAPEESFTTFSPLAPPTAVTVDGPTVGMSGFTYAFTATVTPITASQPISYAWNFGDGTSLIGPSVVSHSWPTSGTHTVAVAAGNGAGTVVGTSTITIAPSFSDIQAGIGGMTVDRGAWGDYDNDGDLDILLAGWNTSGSGVTKIYRNNAGSFSDIYAELPGFYDGTAAWGDYDNDGDLDILLTGIGLDLRTSQIYRNDGGRFSNINAGLLGVNDGAAAWGDYDNDGDLDVLLTGWLNSGGAIAYIYRNTNGSFTNINAGLAPAPHGAVAWGDYDSDGDLDILMAGYGLGPNAKIYRNDNGNFTDINAGVINLIHSSVTWGDYDNDGDLDIVMSGQASGNQYVTKIYRNEGGSFSDIDAGLPGSLESIVAWGDYDSDGDLDILANSSTLMSPHILIYRNDEGSFDPVDPGLGNRGANAIAWGDYNNDGRLDILLGDSSPVSGPSARVYRNDLPTANTRPSAPAGLAASASGTAVTLRWDAASDSKTPTPGLTYNLRVSQVPGGQNVLAPMADGTTGYRQIPQLGNAQHGLTATLTLPGGTYYWSAQAIDTAFAGSLFAPEESFTVTVPPMGITLTGPMAGLTGLSATFTATLTPALADPPITYTWQADDQVLVTYTGSLSHNTTFSWAVTGTKTITVTASNSSGAVTGTTMITINDSLITGLSATNSSSTQLAQATTLTATLTAGNMVSYAWAFGDGSFGSGSPATHIYPTVGVYTAVVTASNGVNILTATTMVTITEVPIAGLNAMTSSPTHLDHATTLTATVTAGSNVDYAWDFGDGSFGSGAVVIHTYPAVGLYTAIVTASNTFNVVTATVPVTITDVPIAGLSLASNSPTKIDQPTVLTASVATGSNVAYTWDLGDGTTGSGTTVSHTYPAEGIYTVVVTAANSVNSLTTSSPVTVAFPFTVTAVSPSRNSVAAARNEFVTAVFNRELNPSSVTTQTFTVRGSQSGVYQGDYTFAQDSATFNGGVDFWPGEEIGVNLSQVIQAADGLGLEPYAWQFRAATQPSSGSFLDSGQRLGNADTLAVVLGDLDNDGDLDAFIGNQYHSEVWVNNGAGAFTDSGQRLGNVSFGDVALGDLDQDGDLDAFIATFNDNPDEVWLNDGHGFFTDSGQRLNSSIDNSGRGVALGDLDGDGDLDAYVVNGSMFSTEYDSVWFNDGTGTFTNSNQFLDSSNTKAVVLGDLDGDGDLDAFVGNGYEVGAQHNRVWLNNGRGYFSNSGQNLGDENTWALALGDVDSDGDLDVLVGNDSGYKTEIWLNDGQAHFSNSGQNLGSSFVRAVALGDVDGDGDLDAIISYDGPDQLLLNNGSGIFTNSGQNLGNEVAGGLDLGDVDNDGDLDFFAGNYNLSGTDNANRVYLNRIVPHLTISKAAPPGVAPGDFITYTLTLTNNGLAPATNIVISDTIPTGVFYISGGVRSNNIVNWAVPFLEVNDTVQVSFVVTATETVTNSVYSVSCAEGVSAAGPAVVTHMLDVPIVELMVSNSSPAKLGVMTTLTARVTTGNHITYTWNFGDGSPLLNIFNTNQQTLVVTHTYAAAGVYTAVVTASNSLSSLSQPTVVTIIGVPKLVITKQGPPAVTLGDLITYTLVVSNNGLVSATHLVITDVLPLGAEYVSGGTLTGQVVSWAVSSLMPDEMTQVSLVVSASRTISNYNYAVRADDEVSAVGSTPVIVTVIIPPLTVTQVSPAGNGQVVSSPPEISAGFSRAISPGTVTTATFTVYGQQTGIYTGSYSLGTTSAQFMNSSPFKPGEEVAVQLSRGLLAADGGTLTPYAWQFRTGVADSTGLFGDSGQNLGAETSMAIALGDIDRDGDIDAYIGNGGSGVADQIWLNNGAGQFSDSGRRIGSFDTRAVALGDLDRDGDLDAFTAHRNTSGPGGSRVWLNDGQGDFSSTGQRLGDQFSQGVALGDLDGDGDMDAFVANGEVGGLPDQVWLNNDLGIFASNGQSLGNLYSKSVALGDLDRDGDLDAFVTSYYGAGDQVWLNDGRGSFSNSGQSLGTEWSTEVALGDIDGDGDLDAFVGNISSNAKSKFWLNNGAGIFTDSGQNFSGWPTYAVALGDVDGDNDLDALISNNDQPNRVWLNNGLGIYTDSGQSLGTYKSYDVDLGDLDGDGDLDAFMVNYNYPSGSPNSVWFNGNSPITGLSASNSSPTRIGSSTYLTATVTAGSNISYTWAFGDGSTGSGVETSHTYPAVGTYTAVVTASNSVGVLTKTTTITITGIPQLSISLDGPAEIELGEPILYTLTITNSGSDTATGLVITSTIPTGAVYISGGIKIGASVRWEVASLPPNQNIQVQFTIVATASITNSNYGVRANGDYSAMGSVVVNTRIRNKTFLPLIVAEN